MQQPRHRNKTQPKCQTYTASVSLVCACVCCCTADNTVYMSISPESLMTTSLEVEPDCDPTFSTAFTTSIPSEIRPKTTCLPSSHDVLMVQMKNCEPLVFGPALAMERSPGPVCLSLKFSSANFSP